MSLFTNHKQIRLTDDNGEDTWHGRWYKYWRWHDDNSEDYDRTHPRKDECHFRAAVGWALIHWFFHHRMSTVSFSRWRMAVRPWNIAAVLVVLFAIVGGLVISPEQTVLILRYVGLALLITSAIWTVLLSLAWAASKNPRVFFGIFIFATAFIWALPDAIVAGYEKRLHDSEVDSELDRKIQTSAYCFGIVVLSLIFAYILGGWETVQRIAAVVGLMMVGVVGALVLYVTVYNGRRVYRYVKVRLSPGAVAVSRKSSSNDEADIAPVKPKTMGTWELIWGWLMTLKSYTICKYIDIVE